MAKNFAMVYDENYAKVFNYIHYRVMNRVETEDITSEVFMKALRHFQSYDETRASIATWLFAIARNAVNDHFSSKKRQNWVSIETAEALIGDCDVEDDVIALCDEMELRALLRTIPERDREVLALRYWGDLSYAEIALQTALSEKNVSVILTRTIAKLRAAFTITSRAL